MVEKVEFPTDTTHELRDSGSSPLTSITLPTTSLGAASRLAGGRPKASAPMTQVASTANVTFRGNSTLKACFLNLGSARDADDQENQWA